MKDQELIDRFVSSFPKLDEMTEYKDLAPLAWQLRAGEIDEYDQFRWTPSKFATDRNFLEPLYALLPARFPPLYELLVLSYRWAEVDLQSFRLLPNPVGKDLSGLLQQIKQDPAFWQQLPRSGYIQFGRGPDMNYDPVCFDIKRRKKNKDYPVVKIDHEQILCNNRIKVVAEIAPSFEDLLIQTIERANKA